MEGMPRLPMMCFQLKTVASNVDLINKIRQLIRYKYDEDPGTFSSELHEFETLQAAAHHPSFDYIGCAALKRYYCQLHFLKHRFSEASLNDGSLHYEWSDLFGKGVTSSSDIELEMSHILYNIGALHSIMGASDSRVSEEGMKMSCTHFQCGAWAFQCVRENFSNICPDLSTDFMTLYSNIMLAQAQECLLEKSMIDHRKSSIIAKVSAQIATYYKQSLKIIESKSVSDIIGSKVCKGWKKYLEVKQNIFNSIAHYYQGLNVEEQSKMGERLSYIDISYKYLLEAQKLAKLMDNNEKYMEAIQFTIDVIGGKLNSCKKENELVYHEKVPDAEVLAEIKGASLVKGVPFSITDSEISGVDIFNRLVPMQAHESSSLYSEEKAKLLREIGTQIEEKNNKLVTFMSALDVDLNCYDSPDYFPEELLEKCAAMSIKSSAVHDLVNAMNKVSSMYLDMENKLDELKAILQHEEKQEKEFQLIMGKRPPSILISELAKEAARYYEAHQKASESNMALHKAMTLHMDNLKLLMLPVKELQLKMPSIKSLINESNEQTLKEMQRLISKVEEMRNQRNTLEAQLRDCIQKDDITNEIINSDMPMEEFFNQQLKKFDPQVTLLQKNMSAQENILKALTLANADFAEIRQSTKEIVIQREDIIKSLICSFDTYQDLLQKADKGVEFYQKLEENITKLLQRVKSVCKVQDEEREESMKSRADLNPYRAKSFSTTLPGNDSDGPKLRDYLNSDKPKLKDYLNYKKGNSKPDYTHSKIAHMTVDSNDMGEYNTHGDRPTPVGSENSYPSSCMDSRINYGLPVSDGQFYQSHQVNPSPTNSPLHSASAPSPSPSLLNQNFQNPYYPKPAANQALINEQPNYYLSQSNLSASSEHPNNYAASLSSKFASVSLSSPLPNSQTVSLSHQRDVLTHPAGSFSPQHYHHSQPTFGGSYHLSTSQESYDPGQNVPYPVQPATPSGAPQMRYCDFSKKPQLQSMPGLESSVYYQNSHMSQPARYNPAVTTSSSFPFNTAPDQCEKATSVIPLSQQFSHLQPSITNVGCMNFTPVPNNCQIIDPKFIPPSSNAQNMTNVSSTDYSQGLYSCTVPSTNYSSVNFPYPVETPGLSSNFPLNASMPRVDYESQSGMKASISHSTPVPIHPGNNSYCLTTAIANQTSQTQSYSNQFVNDSLKTQPFGNIPPHLQASNVLAKYLNPKLEAPESEPATVQVPATVNEFGSSNSNKHPVSWYHVGDQYQQYMPSTIPNHNCNSYQTPNIQSVATNQVTDVTYSKDAGQSSIDDTGKYFSSPYPHGMHGIYYHYGMSAAGSPTNYMNTSHSVQAHLNNESNAKHSSSNSTAAPKDSKTESKPQSKSNLDLLSELDLGPANPLWATSTSDTPVAKNDSQLAKSNEFPLGLETNISAKDGSTIETSKTGTTDLCKSVSDSQLGVRVPHNPICNPDYIDKLKIEYEKFLKFVDGLEKKSLNGPTPLDVKWKEICDYQERETRKFSISVARCYPMKNRFPDILPYDYTRVEMPSTKDDYINASHIKGLSSDLNVIITQCPLLSTYHDFWSMILQEQVELVVCLADAEISNNIYWPEERNKPSIYGSISVSLESVKNNKTWVERIFTLNASDGKPSRVLLHLQLLSWNLNDLTKISVDMVSFAGSIVDYYYQQRNREHPVTIQCLSGVGKSGIFSILLAAIHDLREGKGVIDITSACQLSVKQRRAIIQDKTQLSYLYKAVSVAIQLHLDQVLGSHGSHLPGNCPDADDSNEKVLKNLEEKSTDIKCPVNSETLSVQDPLNQLDPYWSFNS